MLLDVADFFQSLPIWLLLVFFGVGLAGLAAGGEWLCRGAVGLAALLKVKPIIIGLTVVSAATSMPEFVISLFGVLTDSAGLSMGNIVGSNIVNIGLILAISALICPIVIRVQLIRTDVPILIGVSFLFVALCWGTLSRGGGLLLLILLVGYLTFLVRAARRGETEEKAIEEEVDEKLRDGSLGRALLWVGFGAVVLGAAGSLLVSSTVEVAGRLGVSEVLVGVTVVALGTSLPELAASIVAAIRKHADLCAGNIVGSNLFNLILVSGSVAVIKPIEVDRGMFLLEFPVMLFFAVLLWPLIFTGKVVSRNEGFLLLIFYAAFLTVTMIFRSG